jgi:hypothetical protein
MNDNEQRKDSLFDMALIFAPFVFLVVYFIFAILFVQERLYADAANEVFKIIKGKTFPDSGRTMTIFAQLPFAPAVFLSKCGASVSAVTYAYTLAAPITAAIMLLFVCLVNRSTIHAYALLVAMVMDIGGNFFFNYVTLMASFMILLSSSLTALSQEDSEQTRRATLHRWLNIAVLFYCVGYCSGHHTRAIVGLYILGLHFVAGRKFSWLNIGAAVLICVLLGYKTLFPSGYEHKIASGFEVGHWGIGYAGQLLLYHLKHYWGSLLLLSGALALLVVRKRYILTGYVLLALLAFLFVVNGVFVLGKNSFQYYHYATGLVSIFGIAPAVVALRDAKRRTLVMAGLASIMLLVSGFLNIYLNAPHYSERVEYFGRLLRSEAVQKGDTFYVNPDNCHVPLGISWAMAQETLVLSKLLGFSPAKLIAHSEEEKPLDRQIRPIPWSIDVRGGYKLLNTPGALEELGPEKLQNVSLRILMNETRLPAATELKPLIQIRNENDAPLHSGEATDYKLHIGYHWYKGDECIVWDAPTTPLEIDVYSQYTQPFLLKTPVKPGEYRLVVDLVLHSQFWFEINESLAVKVY